MLGRLAARNVAQLLALSIGMGCVVQGSPPPLKGSDGVEIDAGIVSLDPSEVPVLAGADGGAMSCSEGQLIGMGASGWECVTPAGIAAGDAILVENNTISVDLGTAHTQAAYGDHNHNNLYRQLTVPITWSDLDLSGVPATADWPGVIDWAQVVGAPAPTWQMLSETVGSMTNWPGTISYTQVTGVPVETWGTISGSVANSDVWPGTMPYSQLTNVPATTWNTIASTVASTTNWPGTIPYAQVTGSPVVTWSTITGTVTSTTNWPGTVPYSEVTGVPAVTWSSISDTVGSMTAWPGTVPYVEVTDAPAVDWTTVGPTIPNTAAWPGTINYSQVADTPSLNVTGTAPITVSGSPVPLGGTVSIGLSGTVGVSNGGTGASSLSPGVVVSTAASGPLSTVSPGASGNVLTSNGTIWSSQPVPTTGLAKISTGVTTLYVNVGGSDTACSGLVDGPATGSGDCAFATPQHAVDSLPQIIVNPVTIQIDAGTYYDTTSLTTLLDLRKSLQKAGGTITIEGNGGVAILSGLASSGESAPTASIGILIANAIGSSAATPTPPISIQNVTVENIGATGIDIEASKVQMDNVTIQTTGQDGILCEAGSYCELLGTVTVTNAVGAGVHGRFGSWVDVEGGTLTVSSSGSASAGRYSPGVLIEQNSSMTGNGNLVSSTNQGPGLTLDFGSNASLTQPATFMSNVGGAAVAQLPAPTTILVSHGSTLASTNGLTIVAANGVNGITADRNANVSMLPPLGTNGNVSVTCAAGTGANGVVATHNSSVETGGSGSISLTGCTTGVLLAWHGSFTDDGGTGCGARNNPGGVSGDGFSVFTHGCFAACTGTATFECE